jgi:hypothetical protein
MAECGRLGLVARVSSGASSSKPRRGRRRTPESIQKRLDQIDADLATVDPLKRVGLIQERLDLTDELDNLGGEVDLTGLEAAFVAAAGPYSEPKGISKAAWREIGVPNSVLRAAGI